MKDQLIEFLTEPKSYKECFEKFPDVSQSVIHKTIWELIEDYKVFMTNCHTFTANPTKVSSWKIPEWWSRDYWIEYIKKTDKGFKSSSGWGSISGKGD